MDLITSVGVTNPTEYLVSIQDQFFEFIIYCCIFIQDYIHHSLVGENSVKLLLNCNSLYVLTLIGQAYRRDRKDAIKAFKGKLGDLRTELRDALLIRINGRVDRIDGKLDDVLTRMPKKGILEGR